MQKAIKQIIGGASYQSELKWALSFVIKARHEVLLDQSERMHVCNHPSNYTKTYINSQEGYKFLVLRGKKCSGWY